MKWARCEPAGVIMDASEALKLELEQVRKEQVATVDAYREALIEREAAKDELNAMRLCSVCGGDGKLHPCTEECCPGLELSVCEYCGGSGQAKDEISIAKDVRDERDILKDKLKATLEALQKVMPWVDDWCSESGTDCQPARDILHREFGDKQSE